MQRIALCFLCLVAPLALADEARDNRLFETWRQQHAEAVQSFESFVASEHLAGLVPVDQLLRTASDWEVCKSAPYEVPPRTHWPAVASTLRLVAELKRAGVLTTFEVHSAYRNPVLNRCADGAKRSAHTTDYALDITAPGQDQLGHALCAFWNTSGKPWRMGLSRYASGRIHLDTKRYRTWGNKGQSSFCVMEGSAPAPKSPPGVPPVEAGANRRPPPR